MGRSLQSAGNEADGVQQYLLAAYYWMSSHVSLTVAVCGVLLIALGASVVSRLNAVFAGMFGVWGAALVVFGVGSHIVLLALDSYRTHQITQ